MVKERKEVVAVVYIEMERKRKQIAVVCRRKAQKEGKKAKK